MPETVTKNNLFPTVTKINSNFAIATLLGTVLAPHSLNVVPKMYYILVGDVNRFKELNLNEFTLARLFQCLNHVKSGGATVKWPRGNLSLLQVHIINSQ